MDTAATRTLVTQLSEDLSWLEEHCRRQKDQAQLAGQIRLAAALVRNCIGPFLDGQPAAPLHIVVVGGAGAGKSTIANMLSGAVAAEANPQAGFTRHPIAYTSANGAINWPAHLGFLGPLKRLAQPAPSNLDQDVYQIRRVPHDPTTFDLLKDFVVWDCPDMTTWAATGYAPRLTEVSALADLIVYVASDERYNDEVPTQFLHLLLTAGKPVICVLQKMRAADAPSFLNHFQNEVLSKMPPGTVGCLAVPYLKPAQLADPARQAPQYRVPLVNQVAVVGQPPEAARKRVVRTGMNYLLANCDRLLNAARQDLNALADWRTVVQTGQVEFDSRYRKEYLSTEKFQQFDQALIRLIELLELPGIGQYVSKTLYVVRTPYRLLKGFLSKALARPETPAMPEQPVLVAALHGWLDQLRKEAVRRAPTQPLWQHIEKGFEIGLSEMAQERFNQGFRSFQLAVAGEVDQTARAIYAELEQNPTKLNALRTGKFALDIGSIVAGVAIGGTIGWHDLIVVPVVAAITQQLVEWLGGQYVDTQREQMRNRQAALVSQYISAPLTEWLAQWPATGGSTFERLQLAVHRIPDAVQKLDAAVTKALSS